MYSWKGTLAHPLVLEDGEAAEERNMGDNRTPDVMLDTSGVPNGEKGPGRGTTYPFGATCTKWKRGTVGGGEERARERWREPPMVANGTRGKELVIEPSTPSRVTRGRGIGYARTTERTSKRGNARGGRPLSEGERRLPFYDGTLGINATRGAIHVQRDSEGLKTNGGDPPQVEGELKSLRSGLGGESYPEENHGRASERCTVEGTLGGGRKRTHPRKDPPQGVLHNCVGTLQKVTKADAPWKSVCGGDPRAEIDEPE
jgi:hypothetical protein